MSLLLAGLDKSAGAGAVAGIVQPVTVQYQSRADSLFFAPPAPAPDLSGAVCAPPMVRLALSVAVIPAFFGVFALAQLAVPGQASAEFPDHHDVRPAIRVSQQQAVAHVNALPQYAIPPVSWAPTYPERVPPRCGQPVQLQRAVAHTNALPQYAPPLGSWYPVFRERIPPLVGLRAADQKALGYTNALPQYAVPSLSWAPRFPDRIQPMPRLVHGQAYLTLALAQLAVPSLSWQGNLPDVVRLRVAAPSAYPTPTAALFQHGAAPPAPDLSGAEFPSRIPGPRYPPEMGRVVLVRTFVFPDLSWGPEFPDRLIPSRRAYEGRIAFVQVTAAPDRAWASTFPDRVLARLPAIEGCRTTQPAVVIPALLSWGSTWPEQVRRPAALPAAQHLTTATAPSLSALPVPSLSWGPTYPAFLRPLRAATYQYQSLALAPATIANVYTTPASNLVYVLADVITSGVRADGVLVYVMADGMTTTVRKDGITVYVPVVGNEVDS